MKTTSWLCNKWIKKCATLCPSTCHRWVNNMPRIWCHSVLKCVLIHLDKMFLSWFLHKVKWCHLCRHTMQPKCILTWSIDLFQYLSHKLSEILLHHLYSERSLLIKKLIANKSRWRVRMPKKWENKFYIK